MNLAELLRAARSESGLTLRQAADGLQLDHTTLFRYEEDLIHTVPPEILNRMLDFYPLDPEGLYRPLLEKAARQRRRLYEECRTEISPDCLYGLYLRLDERGRRTILALLLQEASHCGGEDFSVT